MAAFGRAVCYRCFKPQSMCICARIVRVDNRTPVWIVQHPRERFHPIGTERIARLGLANVEVRVCHRHGAHEDSAPQPRPTELPHDAALLYPGADVPELADQPAPPSALVIIDGTWAHAHTIYRDTPWLQALPRFRLQPSRPSRYRLRLEPSDASVSTIEAIVEALLRIEPDTPGLRDLLSSFDAMIDDQLQVIQTRHAGKRTRKRPRSTSKVPRALYDDDGLVLVYGEAKSRGLWRRRTRRLVQWTALRLATGECFDRVVAQHDVAQEDRVSERHAWHLGLDADDLASGLGIGELRETWQRFTQPSDVVLAWNKSAIALWRTLAPDGPSLLLKSVYHRMRGRVRGTLDDVVRSEALEVDALNIRGRAGRRIANGLAVVRMMQRESRAP